MCYYKKEQSKSLLLSANALVHYKPKAKLIMTMDATPVGIGAVLSHIIEDGSEKPIYFALRMISIVKENYVQTKYEGQAVIFGISKFHKFTKWLSGAL